MGDLTGHFRHNIRRTHTRAPDGEHEFSGITFAESHEPVANDGGLVGDHLIRGQHGGNGTDKLHQRGLSLVLLPSLGNLAAHHKNRGLHHG